jgi:uracil-DNA glycosylase family 4
MDERDIRTLESEIINCSKCQRLVEFRETVLADSKKYAGERFWRRALPGFGDINGKVLIVGLAPAASGGNRTGRLFTGDKSSDFLMSCLYKAGLTNMDSSTSKNDGLQYINSYITLAVRCVPPENKPEKTEIDRCNSYLVREIQLMTNLKTIIVLGKVAYDSTIKALGELGINVKGTKFGNGLSYKLGRITLFCIFHPSPRNVNTGRISKESFTKMIEKAKGTSEI